MSIDRALRRAANDLRAIAAALPIAVIAGCSGIAGERATGEGSWQSAPSMRNARAAHAVVGTGNGLYSLAGTGAGGRPVLEVERFDGGQWTPETMLPGNGLNAPAAVVLDSKIYVIGGFDTTTNVPVSRVRIYDLRTKAWTEAAPLPNPRGGHAAVAFDGRIHVFGGGNSRSTIADHTVYDPAVDRWRDAEPLPRAEGSPAGVVHRGRIYAIGGRSGPADFGDVYVFDPALQRWRTGPSIEPRGTAGAVEYCGEIHLFGGESQSQNKPLAGAFRLAGPRGQWVELPPLPSARSFARAVVMDGSVYVVGGGTVAGASHESPGSAIVERYTRSC